MPGARLKFFYRVGSPPVPWPSDSRTSKTPLDSREVRAFTDLAGVNYDQIEDRVALGQAVSLIRSMRGSADLYIDPASLPDPDDRSIVALLLAAVDSYLIVGHDGKRAVRPEPTDNCKDIARVCTAASTAFLTFFAVDDSASAWVLKRTLRLTGREAAMILNRARRTGKSADMTGTMIDYRARTGSRARFPLYDVRGGGRSAPIKRDTDLSDPMALCAALLTVPLFGPDEDFSWRPHNTAEHELLSAIYRAAGSSLTLGEPREDTPPQALEAARRLIPFVANVISLQYLNDVAAANDLATAARLAQELRRSGMSLREISEELTCHGYATRRGAGRWSASAVKTLIEAGALNDTTKEQES